VALSEEQIDRAIKRIPKQSNASIKQVLENAKLGSAGRLVEACEDELKARASVDWTMETAGLMADAAARMVGKPLVEVIEIAFSELLPNPNKLSILRWIAAHPGGSSSAAEAAYTGKAFLLVVGHLIYDRLGYFRPFITTSTMSDILLARTNRLIGCLRRSRIASP
jgi:hypothetical protein